MELRNSESSERYVHVTQSSHERHIHVVGTNMGRICGIGDKVGIVKMPPVSPILNLADTDVAFVHDAGTIRTMTQIRNRDNAILSLNICWMSITVEIALSG